MLDLTDVAEIRKVTTKVFQRLGRIDVARTGHGGLGPEAAQVKTLDDARAVTNPYPRWHRAGFPQRNPAAV